MSIFNSLGSNYSNRLVLKSFIPGYGRSDILRHYLLNRYKSDDVVLTYKGRQAILLALRRLGLAKDSKVAVNGYTCYAVYQAIDAAGLIPYYVDIEPGRLNFSAEALEQALADEPDIKAVMIQNTLGFACDIDGIKQVCEKAGLPLIEDLAHSIGLKYGGKTEAGRVGVAAALSFSQDKMVDGVSGGALIWHAKTPSAANLHRLGIFNRFKDWLYPGTTWIIRHTHRIFIGRVLQKLARSSSLLSKPMDGRGDIAQGMTAWHSRMIMDGFAHLDKVIEHRRHIADVYKEMLPDEIQIEAGKHDVFIRFPIRVSNRKRLVSFLKSQRIYVSDVWYESPISPKRSLPLTNYRGQCPNAQKLADEMLNLPTHVNVSRRQAVKIAEKVNQWLSNQNR